MHDELVNRLRRCNQFKCNGCDYENVISCRVKLNAEAADAIEEEDMAFRHLERDYKDLCRYLPKWISVTERLPNDRRDVLVYAGVMFPYITVGYYDGLWKFSFNDEEIAGSADYWMPLPEPPKEET